MVPIYLDPSSGRASGVITIGAMGDSYYEYLLKIWIQSGKKDTRAREEYDRAIDGIMKRLLQTTSGGLTYVADLNGNQLNHKMDHLVCFLPGVLALGSYLSPDGHPSKERDMKVAQELMYTCYQMYKRQPTGLAPEFVVFHKNQGEGKDMTPAPTAFFNILRPETSESLFVLHYITKNPRYREWGWEIFQAFDKYCRTPYGFGSWPDVRNTDRHPDDRMESFFLAETLKYLYLLQDPDDTIPLEKYVFNTEAHPLSVLETENDGPTPNLSEDRSPQNLRGKKSI